MKLSGRRAGLRRLVFLENTLRVWLLAAAVAVVVYAALHIVRTLAVRQLSALAVRTNNELDDIIADALRGTKVFFLLLMACRGFSAVPPAGT